MAFEKKEWKDRLAEFAGRRILKDVSTNESKTYDVSRAEGRVSREGDAFSAANMNDLETRIANAITATDNSVTELNNNMGGVRFGITEDGQPGYKKDGADTVYPFNSLNPIKMTLHMNVSFPLWIPFNQRSILIYGNLESVTHYYGVDDTDSRDRSNPLEHTSDGSGNNMITTIPYSRYRYVVIWYASTSTEYRTYRIEWK